MFGSFINFEGKYKKNKIEKKQKKIKCKGK